MGRRKSPVPLNERLEELRSLFNSAPSTDNLRAIHDWAVQLRLRADAFRMAIVREAATSVLGDAARTG